MEELFRDAMLRDEIAQALTGIFDLERIMTRIVYGSANGRELRALCTALKKLPALKSLTAKNQRAAAGNPPVG